MKKTTSRFDTKYLIGAIAGIALYLVGVQMVNAVAQEVEIAKPEINLVTGGGVAEGGDATRGTGGGGVSEGGDATRGTGGITTPVTQCQRVKSCTNAGLKKVGGRLRLVKECTTVCR